MSFRFAEFQKIKLSFKIISFYNKSVYAAIKDTHLHRIGSKTSNTNDFRNEMQQNAIKRGEGIFLEIFWSTLVQRSIFFIEIWTILKILIQNLIKTSKKIENNVTDICILICLIHRFMRSS